eukprot:jgi/Hompol1/2078/HPOL_003784-RA
MALRDFDLRLLAIQEELKLSNYIHPDEMNGAISADTYDIAELIERIKVEFDPVTQLNEAVFEMTVCLQGSMTEFPGHIRDMLRAYLADLRQSM